MSPCFKTLFVINCLLFYYLPQQLLLSLHTHLMMLSHIVAINRLLLLLLLIHLMYCQLLFLFLLPIDYSINIVVFNFWYAISLSLQLYSSTTVFIYWCLHLLLLWLYSSTVFYALFIYWAWGSLKISTCAEFVDLS